VGADALGETYRERLNLHRSTGVSSLVVRW
jgi:hypothetical protein